MHISFIKGGFFDLINSAKNNLLRKEDDSSFPKMFLVFKSSYYNYLKSS